MSDERENNIVVIDSDETNSLNNDSTVIRTKADSTNQNVKKNSIIWIVAYVIIGLISFILIRGSIGAGADAAADKFQETYLSEKNKTYKSFYQTYYDKYEKKYRVSNTVTIVLENIKEIKELEVLRVSDVEYIIENGDVNEDSITAWLEVPGEGSFIVDLAGAEFIKNDSKHYVHVKVPYPELKNIRINYENVTKLFFDNNIFDDSIKVGETLARRQLENADMLIKRELMSNKDFYKTAQDSTKAMIISIIKQLNPDIEDLKVDVDFY